MRLDQTIRTLRGTLLVLAAGAVWGITPALSRIAIGMGTPPLGLAVWVNAVAAVFCLTVAAMRGRLLRPDLRHLGFFAEWALIAAVLYRLVTFTVAGHVEASMIALISGLRGFMVFAIAAPIALETPSLRRLGGLAVGLAGVAVVLVERGIGTGGGIWIFATLLLPLLFAIQGILIGARRPKEIDVFAAVGFMMTLCVAMLLPIALATNTMVLPAWPIDRLDLITVTLGIATSLSIAFAMSVIALAGPVFASQTAYSQTIAGVIWGVLLLNESLVPSAWAALVLMLIGLWMVEPKRAGEDFSVTLPLSRRSP